MSPDSFTFQNPVATNPGYFLNPADNVFLYSVATGIDIFMIWTLVLTAIGFTCVSKVKRGTSHTQSCSAGGRCSRCWERARLPRSRKRRGYPAHRFDGFHDIWRKVDIKTREILLQMFRIGTARQGQNADRTRES